MKKIILGIVLGIGVNKGLATYHSYVWWKAEKACRPDTRPEPFLCIDEKVGNVKYLGLASGWVTYYWQKWEWRY